MSGIHRDATFLLLRDKVESKSNHPHLHHEYRPLILPFRFRMHPAMMRFYDLLHEEQAISRAIHIDLQRFLTASAFDDPLFTNILMYCSVSYR